MSARLVGGAPIVRGAQADQDLSALLEALVAAARASAKEG